MAKSTSLSSIDAACTHKKDKIRETARKSMAAHRSRMKNEAESLQKRINMYRGLLGEELLKFSNKKKTSKGKRKPTYNPPEGAVMTPQELEQWKRAHMLERKRLSQAKADREKKEELEFLREEYNRVTKKYVQLFGRDALLSGVAGGALPGNAIEAEACVCEESSVIEPTAFSGFNSTSTLAPSATSHQSSDEVRLSLMLQELKHSSVEKL